MFVLLLICEFEGYEVECCKGYVVVLVLGVLCCFDVVIGYLSVVEVCDV